MELLVSFPSIPITMLAWMRWSLMLRLDFLQNKSMTFHTADKYIAERVIKDLQNTDVSTSGFVECLWYNMDCEKMPGFFFFFFFGGKKPAADRISKNAFHNILYCIKLLRKVVCKFSIYFMITLPAQVLQENELIEKILLMKHRYLSSTTPAYFSQLVFVNLCRKIPQHY